MGNQVYNICNSRHEILSVLQNMNMHKIFIVHGKHSYECSGAKNEFDWICNELNIEYTEFCEFSSNPKIDDVYRGLDVFNSSTYDAIVAVGGGTAIDIAKLIRYMHSYGTIDSKQNKKTELVSLIACPTTAGTGAEATHFSVCYIDGEKHSIAHSDMLPDVVLLNGRFTYGNSLYLTRCTLFDAFAQAIESYWSVYSTDESKQYSIQAIKTIVPIIERGCCDINSIERNDLLYASYLAGCAINITKTTAPHAFSYEFTSKYNIPHGHAVALTFPVIADYNINSKGKYNQCIINVDTYQKSMEELLSILGITNNEVCNWFGHICKLCDFWNIKIKSSDVKDILTHVNMERLKNNPINITPIMYDDIASFIVNKIHI